MAGLTNEDVISKREEILKTDKVVRGISAQYNQRKRRFEIEQFIDHRVRTLFPPQSGETEESSVISILNDVRGIESAIEEVFDKYDFSGHVDLNAIEKVGPRARYRHERRGWGERDRVLPKNTLEHRRKQLVRSIIWRSATLHYDEKIWEESNRIKLLVLLDRRLHMVELMRYHVSVSGLTGRGNRDWRLRIVGDLSSDPTPKWTDGHVLRWFEYPRVPSNKEFQTAVTEWLNHVRKSRPDLAAAEENDWNATRQSDDAVTFDIPSGRWFLSRPTKPANAAEEFWFRDPDKHVEGYRWFLTDDGADDPVAAIVELFLPSIVDDPTRPFSHSRPDEGWKNWWERNHLYCDQVIHALLLKALVVGQQHAKNNWLEAIIREPGRGRNYIQIYYPSSGAHALGSDRRKPDPANPINSDPFFDPGFGPIAQLEIGDSLIVNNHPVYPKLTKDVWQLENAVVVDIRGPPSTRNIWVQGHGTGAGPLTKLLDYVIKKLNEHFGKARKLIESRPQGTEVLSYDGISNNLAFRPGLAIGDPDKDLNHWGVIWADVTRNFKPESGIRTISKGDPTSVYLFPLWRRSARGRFQAVKADRKMVEEAFYFRIGKHSIFRVKPRIVG